MLSGPRWHARSDADEIIPNHWRWLAARIVILGFVFIVSYDELGLIPAVSITFSGAVAFYLARRRS